MNRNDCKLLYMLYKEECFDAFQAITATKLSQICELSGTKVRKTLNEFVSEGYVGEGYKKSQARTFYVTNSGIECLKTMMPADSF